ncbi:hypothetical protein FRC12_004105 [Ceratobasidium sp. 428]|nr:hypothetical protein FRC12_004105 [Ceratobasidium sp. 428]
MHCFVIALALLVVTGLLTVTGLVSFSLTQFVIFPSTLTVLYYSYVSIVEFVREIVAVHEQCERYRLRTLVQKWYSDNYYKALWQLAVEQLRNKRDAAMSKAYKAVTAKLLKIADRLLAPLGVDCAKLKAYRRRIPYSTCRILFAFVCAAYPARYIARLALRHAFAMLAGLALWVRGACCTLTALAMIITGALVWTYSLLDDLKKPMVLNCMASIGRTLQKSSTYGFHLAYSGMRALVASRQPKARAKPQHKAKRTRATNTPPVDSTPRPAPYYTVSQTIAEFRRETPPVAPEPAYTGAIARPRTLLEAAEARARYQAMRDEWEKEVLEKAREEARLANERRFPSPCRSSRSSASTSGYGSATTRMNSVFIGSRPVPTLKNLEPPRLMMHVDQYLRSSAAIGSSTSFLETSPSSTSQPVYSPTTSSTVSSELSLPELDRSTLTSEDSTSFDTSADEHGPTRQVSAVCSAAKGSQGNPKRTVQIIAQAQSKTSPMHVPKLVVEARAKAGENKAATILRWSQRKERVALKKQAAKNKASMDVDGPSSPTLEPMDSTLDWEESDWEEMEEDEVPMDISRQGSPKPAGVAPMAWSPSPAQVSSLVPQNMEVDEESSGARRVKGLPRRTAARSSRSDAPTTSKATTPTPMELPPRPPRHFDEDVHMAPPPEASRTTDGVARSKEETGPRKIKGLPSRIAARSSRTDALTATKAASSAPKLTATKTIRPSGSRTSTSDPSSSTATTSATRPTSNSTTAKPREVGAAAKGKDGKAAWGRRM